MWNGRQSRIKLGTLNPDEADNVAYDHVNKYCVLSIPKTSDTRVPFCYTWKKRFYSMIASNQLYFQHLIRLNLVRMNTQSLRVTFPMSRWVVCVHSEPFAPIYGRISLCRDDEVLGILEAPDKNCESHGQISLLIDVKRYVNWIVINKQTRQF